MAKTTLTRFLALDGTEYTISNVQSWQDNFANRIERLATIPGADGGFNEYGSAPGPVEKGTVQASFIHRVGTRADVTAVIDALRSLTDLGLGYLFMQPADPTEAERWCLAKLQNIDDPHLEDRHTDLWHRAQVTWSVADPAWRRQGTENAIWGLAEWGDPWGTSPQAVSGTETTISLTNNGNATALCRVVISCDTGETAQDPTVQRLDSSGQVIDQVKYTGTLTAGDELVINARSQSVELNGADAYDATFQSDIEHPAWMRALPGSNDYRVLLANAGDACSVGVKFFDTWR